MTVTQDKMFIGGKWIDASSDDRIEVVDPSTGAAIGSIARGTPQDIDQAVSAAQRSFDTVWGPMEPAERGRRLQAFARILDQERDELVELECRDVGKPLRLAEKEVDNLVRNFEFYAGAADKIHGEVIPFTKGHMALALREPLGVTAQIIPWNGPATLFGRSVASALAAGNTCVVKPAEDACLTILRIAELWQEADMPEGAINIVTGYGNEAGAALVGHPGIEHVSFTGSPEVGTIVQQAAAVNHVPVVLELGGKSPNIVFEDADIDQVVDTIVFAVTINSGQVCAAGTRLLLHASIYDRVLDRLAERFQALRVGSPRENPDLGPLISRKQLGRVTSYVDLAERDGLHLVAEGQITQTAHEGGFFCAPRLYRDVAPSHRLAQEEIFGPVLVAMRFNDEEEAVRLANGTEYGLVAGIWTRDGARQMRMINSVRAGQVFVNCYLAGAGVELPFGGSGKSGHGREKGLEALHGLTKTKTAVLRY